MFPLLEGLRNRLMVRFKAEDFDECSWHAIGVSRFAEKEAGVDDLGVVEEQHRIGRQQFRKVRKLRLADVAIAVDKQFRLVALFERELGDAFFGKGIVVVGDGYIFYCSDSFVHLIVAIESATYHPIMIDMAYQLCVSAMMTAHPVRKMYCVRFCFQLMS